ncbi:MAG: Aha1 domain protein, partial [Actinoallomurus sp.]|nr:Aha1 domain protein [Actinoallomurus sp.]
MVSWIEVRLTTEPEGGTRFELDHIAHVDEHWAEYGPGAVGIGWDMGLMGLALHLSSGTPADPEESAAWAASDESRRFVSLSSRRWCEASIAAGTDEAEAQAAADRTTAAYTAPASAPESRSDS